MASSTMSEQTKFAQAAQTALQRITQAQMALAFLGDDERAERVSVELNRVTELVGAMQTRHAALVNAHEALQDAVDSGTSHVPGQGFMVESIGAEPLARDASTQVGTLWMRLRGLVPLLVAACVLVAVGTGAVRPILTTARTAASNNGASSTASVQAHLGGTLQAGMMSCTLVSAALHSADEQSSLAANRSATVAVHVQIHNDGSSFVSYTPSTFHLKSGAGELTNEESATSSNLGSGELAPGANVEGDLVFAVRLGDHAAELTWKPLLWGDTNEHAWLLGM